MSQPFPIISDNNMENDTLYFSVNFVSKTTRKKFCPQLNYPNRRKFVKYHNQFAIKRELFHMSQKECNSKLSVEYYYWKVIHRKCRRAYKVDRNFIWFIIGE